MSDSADDRRLEEIQRLAYQLWQLAGKPEGIDLDIWLEAERRYERYHRYTVQP